MVEWTMPVQCDVIYIIQSIVYINNNSLVIVGNWCRTWHLSIHSDDIRQSQVSRYCWRTFVNRNDAVLTHQSMHAWNVAYKVTLGCSHPNTFCNSLLCKNIYVCASTLCKSYAIICTEISSNIKKKVATTTKYEYKYNMACLSLTFKCK